MQVMSFAAVLVQGHRFKLLSSQLPFEVRAEGRKQAITTQRPPRTRTSLLPPAIHPFDLEE